MPESRSPLNDSAERRKFWFGWINGCVKEFRPELQIDEAGYLMVAIEGHSQMRDFLLYTVLDDIQKAATAILRWDELLGDDSAPAAPEDRQVERIVLESVLDEQSVWTRKLVEALTAAICFEQANEVAYYRHYLLLGELRERRAMANDLESFYACPNQNIRVTISRLAGEIADLEASGEVDFDRTWYLARLQALPKEALERASPGSFFSSERARLTTALGKASASEKLVLGLSYDRSFGRASRDLHFGPWNMRVHPSDELVERGLSSVAMLSLNLLWRLQLLTGIRPNGPASKRLKEIFESNTGPERLVDRATRGDAEVGDFVLAYGDPAQVLDISESDLGYRSYHVLYVAERPLPEISEDWFLAQEVRVLHRARDLLADLERALDDAAAATGVRISDSWDEEARMKALR